MIIFGWRTKVLEGASINDICCPNCGHTTHHTFGVVKYFHLYWIPTVLYGARTAIICAHCRLNRYAAECPDIALERRRRLHAVTLPVGRMLRYYAGAFAAVPLIIAVAVTTASASVPRAGDVQRPLVQDVSVSSKEASGKTVNVVRP